MTGIVAAQTNNPYGIIGAATGVTLGAYRVFGCDGSSPDGKRALVRSGSDWPPPSNLRG